VHALVNEAKTAETPIWSQFDLVSRLL